MLEFNNLTKRYDDKILALDDFTLKVRKGEIFCLLGANGAGKTTIVNLILNYIDPSSGSVNVNGLDVNEKAFESKEFIAYIPENVALYDNMTVTDNLEFFAKLSGRNKLSKFDYYSYLRRVGMPENSFNKKLSKVSKGMKQKLAIAIAVIKDSPVIILDEPTAGLDPKAASEFLETLLELKKEEKTIFMVTHDIFRAKTICDKIGIMKQGRLVMILTKEELASQDLEKIYLDYMKQ
ncbi:MAG: ABC transporter ATP-binding protein [Pseudomonadota bacterium]